MKIVKSNITGSVLLTLINKEEDDTELRKIKPNTTDGALEKHVPVVKIENGVVYIKVGSINHPMLPEHYIQFIILETDNGMYSKTLNPGENPEASFAIKADEKVVAAYEYCNLHGFWKYILE